MHRQALEINFTGRILRLYVLAVLAWQANLAYAADPTRPPNIVLIVADDLGYGDLGCYGSQDTKTPSINRLAAQGLRFTDFHSNGPMCTPTRVALLTGRYQQRYGPKFDGPLSDKADFDSGLPLQAVTLAEALKKAGYATGMFGKWHLGYQAPFLPTRQGFDEFRGLVSGDGDHHSHIDRSGREDWWHNEEIKPEAGYTAELLTRHSIRFIENNKDRPFFLYVPHLAIHFPWQGPGDPAQRRQGADYWQDKWGIIKDRDNVRPHVREMIHSLDKSVGQIVATLERLNLERRTLVFVTSDNGGYLTYGSTFKNISSNGPLRGQKGELFEGGHRVPAIAWWPGRIKPGTCTDTVITFDLFPTFLNLAGGNASAQEPRLDGVDLGPLLFDNGKVTPRHLFWRAGSWHAVRHGPWKLVRHGDRQPTLYNLEEDLGERCNRAGEAPELVKSLLDAYANWERDLPKK